MSSKHSRLSLKERIQIETLLNEKKSKAYIAKILNRSRSTITREINKWITCPEDKYDAELAYWHAKDDYLNKRNLDKISTYNRLKIFVYKGLLKDGRQNKFLVVLNYYSLITQLCQFHMKLFINIYIQGLKLL
ncbi:MAG: helix-turn-helix domain-containing protein [Saprospiraceae bacterium]|nr:helix-turn-helix domain-containing protein [Saprospiraceae bacterium]